MRRWYRFCRLLCRCGYTFLLRGRVFGLHNVPRRGGVLLVCNHQSFLDPVLATQALPRECHYMARDTLFRNPWFGRLIESLNAFPVKRDSADVGAVRQTLRRLRRGALVAVFPEATRTPDGRVQALHSGVALIAGKARVPVVPTLILGAFEAWPRQARLPRPRPVIVAYGSPLHLERLAAGGAQQRAEIIRRRILELGDRYRRHPLLAGRLAPLPDESDAPSGPAQPQGGRPAASGAGQ